MSLLCLIPAKLLKELDSLCQPAQDDNTGAEAFRLFCPNTLQTRVQFEAALREETISRDEINLYGRNILDFNTHLFVLFFQSRSEVTDKLGSKGEEDDINTNNTVLNTVI